MRPDLFANFPQEHILLYGVPGNGKTFIAEAIGEMCNVPFLSVKASALKQGDQPSEALVNDLFEFARSNGPMILFLDEADSLLQRRKNGDDTIL